MDRVWEKLLIAGAKIGCHQRPDRSFFYKNKYQFPICARCTGVALGYIVAICSIKVQVPVVVCLTLCTLMLIDWLIQFLGVKESTNLRRLLTGIMGGFGLLRLELIILSQVASLLLN